MISPRTSIFISHVNGDPDAEPVLAALAGQLKAELAPTHDAYDVAYDREIIAGKEWRTAIYEWLFDCAAAVILVSQQAFEAEKPWVSHEATFLTITQTRRRDLAIIPVLLTGTNTLLTSRPTFKPGRLSDIQALRFPDPPRLDTPQKLVTAIAERLKQELPALGAKPLFGLAADLRDKLSELPEPCRNAAAGVLDPAGNTAGAAHVAECFLAADEATAQQAFYALCDKARHKGLFRLKQDIAHLLGATRVREQDARPIAIEAALPSGAGYGRALLIDSEDPDIVDLYLIRAARRSPHAWDLTDAPSVLEFGHLEDLEKGVRKIIAGKFGTAAGRSEDLQMLRGNAVIAAKRRSGFPVVLRLDYSADREPAATCRAIRGVCPEVMILYTAPPETSAESSSDAAIRQIPLLGLDGYVQVIGPYGALIEHCRDTNPDEEAAPG